MSPKQQNGDTSPRGSWRAEVPFNDLAMLPPTVELETKAVLKQCISARAALGELKQAVELTPNPGMLIGTLPFLEAQASSAIENIVTTADEMFRHIEAATASDPATKEALRYREAILAAARELETRPITTGLAESICSRIKDRTMEIRRVPGTTLANAATGEVVYTPPVGAERLRDLLSNWERFLHEETSLDPLVRIVAGHYQFEAIHPFSDGNGRTGRVLNSLLFVEQGLLPLPILYLSRYILDHRDEYSERLLAVTREGAWEAWLLFLLRGIEETAHWTTAKVIAVRALAKHSAEHVRSVLPKIYSHELMNVLFEQPYCRIAHVVDAGVAERQAASRYLKALAEIGVLREEESGREKIFGHPKLLKLLTGDANEFEAYAPA